MRFNKSRSFPELSDLTIGIEEEYQIVDRRTGELTSIVSEMLEQGKVLFRDQVKPEMLQSQIEIGTTVCRSVAEARTELQRLRGMVSEVAEKNNCAIVAAGTHPFSHWEKQSVVDKERYLGMIKDTAMIARRMLIFGMHVHIGIKDPDLRVDIMNQMNYFMPHILALSTSSPFWNGRETGLKSYRKIVFSDLPRTGLSPYFETHGEYEDYINTLIRTKCIAEPTKIWWDMRPHPRFPTLEVRVCDCMTSVEEVISVAALIQALAAKLIRLRLQNQSWRLYHHGLLNENMFRAIKDGVNGTLLDLGQGSEVQARFLIEELVDFVRDMAEMLGTEEELQGVLRILKTGTSADRQLKVFREKGEIKAVVDHLCEETLNGVQ